MKLIKDLSEQIDEEIDGARCYAKMAIHYKGENLSVARLMHSLSEEEMGHVNKLHEAVARAITEYRSSNGDPPAPMMAVYEYLHDKQMEKAAEVKMLQKQFDE